ncbi:MAG: Peptidase rhomboid domain [Sphingobacteriales bacterium]|nr:Peptidase rhomboid domain [Sphingobacteriales bacterium]
MNTYGSSPFSNIPPVVKNLLIINVICFIAAQLFKDQFYSLFPIYYYESPFFRIWQPITYMFMHSSVSFTHILFNMFALFTFGGAVENRLGSKRFLNYYLLTGLGAILLQFVVQNIELYNVTGYVFNRSLVWDLHINEDGSISYQYAHDLITNGQATKIIEAFVSPMVGASGAIFGVLIAFGMLFPEVELFIMFIPVPVKAKYLIPVYIVIELFLGVAKISGDSIAHFAHIGGALFGYILIKLWGINRPRKFYE